MSHRPYPNADRSRHQLERHDDETPPLRAPRPLSTFERQFFENASSVMRMASPNAEALGARIRAAFRPRPASSEEKSA